jgi:DNA-directed RNA polymerase specialized sigma24 family protein
VPAWFRANLKKSEPFARFCVSIVLGRAPCGEDGMPLLERVAPQLPYLRRYARALTGSQESGDACVRATVEALAAGSRELGTGLSPRVALFQVFHAVWNEALEAPDSRVVVSFGPRDTPEQRLLRITPRSRQALLLTALEGFSPTEASEVLRCSPAEVVSMVSDAHSQIQREVATDVLIIEDEPVIAVDIEWIMHRLGHRVCAVASTRAEARAAVASRRPGLVLADILLADGSSGIDAVGDILKEFSVPVVFITAYPERLLTGQRLEPTYLITKPFRPETVTALASQALFFHQYAEAERA